MDEYVYGVDRFVWVHTEAGSMELFLDGMGGSIVAKDGQKSETQIYGAT